MEQQETIWGKYGARLLAILALAFAAFVIWYAGWSVRLEDTKFLQTQPVLLNEGWSAITGGKTLPLKELSRTAAGCEQGPLQLTCILPSGLRGNLVLCFQTKNESVRVWLGDKLIYTYGEVPQRVYGFGVGAVRNLVRLPESAGGKALTVELQPIGGRTGLAPYQFLLGTRGDVMSYLLRSSWPVASAVLLLGLIGLGALVLSGYGLLRRCDWAHAMFCFAVFVLLATLWTLTDSGLMQFVCGNKGVCYLLFGCSFYLLCTPFALFMAAVLPQHRVLFRVLSLVNTVYALVRIGLYMAGLVDFEWALWLLHVLIAVMILCINITLWLPWLKTRKLEQPALCLAVSAFTLISCISLVNFYWNDKLDVLRNGYSSGFYVGIVLFVIITAVGVARKTRALQQQAFRAAFLERRAYTDDLTGLLNVKGFDDKCEVLLADAPAKCCAVVDFDVNFFSQYNATNGLESGDKLLLRIAEDLRSVCRPGELCARQEADHFVCLLLGRDLGEILDRIHAADKASHQLLTKQMLLISYGVVQVTDPSASVAALRNQAVVAKRTVKGNYETNLAIYDHSLHEQQLRELKLLSGFEAALERNAYVVFLQPKIDPVTETLGGAEALVRRLEPDGTVTSAGPIIDALERKGFVAQLDYYMLDLVCQFQRRCLEQGRKTCPISSNFSRVHLYDPDFPAHVTRIVDQYRLPHSLIELELTETVFSAGKTALQSMARELHQRGFQVSIDDFGSGYSSLNMLKDVDVDTIKLDREFLADFAENRKAGTIIRHTLALAREMGIATVAEGIETPQQLAFLRRQGCTLVQGYYYSQPLPAAEFLEKYLPVP